MLGGFSTESTHNIPLLSAASFRGFARDKDIVRTLRDLQALPHLTHHHLARYGPLLGRPYLLTAHGLIRYFDLKGLGVFINPPNLRDRLCLHLDYRGFASANAVIAVSHSTKRDLTCHLGIPAGRIFVIYEGLDHDLFRPVQRRLIDPPYILFVGSEHPRKNLSALLRAFAALKREPRFHSLPRQGRRSGKQRSAVPGPHGRPCPGARTRWRHHLH